MDGFFESLTTVSHGKNSPHRPPILENDPFFLPAFKQGYGLRERRIDDIIIQTKFLQFDLSHHLVGYFHTYDSCFDFSCCFGNTCLQGTQRFFRYPLLFCPHLQMVQNTAVWLQAVRWLLCTPGWGGRCSEGLTVCTQQYPGELGRRCRWIELFYFASSWAMQSSRGLFPTLFH